jgi:hypothetical protein
MQVPVFVKDLAERAVKTAAQTAVTVLGAEQLNVLHVDWATVAGLTGGATLLSVLTSLASLKFGSTGTASVTNAVQKSGA